MSDPYPEAGPPQTWTGPVGASVGGPYPYPAQRPVPGGPYPYPVRPPATGAEAWWCGLLLCVPLPGIGSVIAPSIMIGVGQRLRRRGAEPARTVGAQAANWGLTYLLATLILLPLHYFLLFALTDDPRFANNFFPVGIPITLWAVISVVHVIVSIAGGVHASQYRTLPRALCGIPFFS